MSNALFSQNINKNYSVTSRTKFLNSHIRKQNIEITICSDSKQNIQKKSLTNDYKTNVKMAFCKA